MATESAALLPPNTAILGVGPELIALPKKSNSLCITLPASAGIFSANPTRDGWHRCEAANASFMKKEACGESCLTIFDFL